MKKHSVVRAFIFNQDGDILLVRHRENTPFALPGGHVESGESLHDAMLREIQEETGSNATFFDIDPSQKISNRGGKLTNQVLPISIYELEVSEKKTTIEYIFLMEMKGDIQKVQDDEIVEYDWYDPEKILTMIPDQEIWGQYIQILSKIIDDE